MFLNESEHFIFQQRPDCNLANQRAGVTFVELRNAIVNRQYESVKQSKRCKYFIGHR